MARCGETLIRQFENAFNAEKPLKIQDFDPETVSTFFKFVEERSIDCSKVTHQLAIMAHLYQVLPLYKICEKYLAETIIFDEDNIDVWINFANAYSSNRLTKSIFLWAKQNAKYYENWQGLIGNNQEFIKMAGILSLGLDKRRLFRYNIEQSESIYLFPLE